MIKISTSEDALASCRLTVDTGEDDEPNQGNPSAVWLEPPRVREGLAVKALGFAGAVEEDVGDAHDDIVNETCRFECQSSAYSTFYSEPYLLLSPSWQTM